ncbi:hypothetical protein Tco_0347052 [Tanacetum coccineum]
MAAYLMMILEDSRLYEEFHKVDHHENGVSWSIEVNIGEPVGSTGLGVAATGPGETTLGGGLKNSSNIGWNKIF